MQATAIEWADATWNPTTGCTRVSAGCDHCYAETLAERFRGTPAFPNGFDLTLKPERLDQPLHWRKPKKIFVNSMSDLFHKEIPDTFLARVFDTMERADWHIYQVLTKRSPLMKRFTNARYAKRAPPPHIWLGVSVEDSQAKIRIKHLQETNAAVRFLSIEPLLASVGVLDLTGIHWVIVGGESGPDARPMDEAWALDVRDQCLAAKVPFLFKQWGGFRPKSGGRLLQGRTWDEYPISANQGDRDERHCLFGT